MTGSHVEFIELVYIWCDCGHKAGPFPVSHLKGLWGKQMTSSLRCTKCGRKGHATKTGSMHNRTEGEARLKAASDTPGDPVGVDSNGDCG